MNFRWQFAPAMMAAWLCLEIAARAADPPPPANTEIKPLETSPGFRSLTPAGRANAIRQQLSKVIDIDKPFDGDFKDILEYISDRYELTFIIDSVAFKNVDPPLDNVDTTKSKLPKLPGVTLHTVLRFLLDPIDGTYFVRRDFIEITTRKALRERLGNEPTTSLEWQGSAAKTLLGEPVNLNAKEMSFADAVRELADTTGANIVIDPRAKEIARKPITATLQQAPLRTALRVLADMVELKVVALDNILYVTTPENAEKFAKEVAANLARPELVPAPAPIPPPQQKKEEIPPGARRIKG